MECRRGLAIRILSVRPSICLSVCLSVKRVNCDKTEARSVQIFIPYERSFSDLSAIAERLVHIGWSTQWRGEKFSTGVHQSVAFFPIYPYSAALPKYQVSLQSKIMMHDQLHVTGH